MCRAAVVVRGGGRLERLDRTILLLYPPTSTCTAGLRPPPNNRSSSAASPTMSGSRDRSGNAERARTRTSPDKRLGPCFAEVICTESGSQMRPSAAADIVLPSRYGSSVDSCAAEGVTVTCSTRSYSARSRALKYRSARVDLGLPNVDDLWQGWHHEPQSH